MDKIIGFDFDGVIVRSDIASKLAHEKWYEIMSGLLDDDSIRDFAENKDYIKSGIKITGRYTGLDVEGNEKILNFMARNFYQMIYLNEFDNHSDPVYSGVLDLIKSLKKMNYKLALITMTPSEALRGICDKIGLNFDYVVSSNINGNEIKDKLLISFLKDNKLFAYITGNKEENKLVKDKSPETKTFLAVWEKDNQPDKYCDYVVRKPEKILELL